MGRKDIKGYLEGISSQRKAPQPVPGAQVLKWGAMPTVDAHIPKTKGKKNESRSVAFCLDSLFVPCFFWFF
jgi:hypothetical protein